MRARFVCLLLLGGFTACVRAPRPPPRLPPPAPLENTASLTGSVIATGEIKADLAGAIVFLEPIADAGSPANLGELEIRLRKGRFEPRVLVVQRGQRITWANLDPIFHGVFSFSSRNRFDLGMFAPNERRSISLAMAGPVRFHCPIHVGEGGIVFVAPSPYLSRASRRAQYAIHGVPPGRHLLSAWSDGWSATAREITLSAGESAHADVLLAPERG